MEPQKHYVQLITLLLSSARLFGQELLRLEDTENDIEQNVAVSNETINAYDLGVHMGIINPEKYPLKSFEIDERNIFRDLYKNYLSFNGSRQINYQDWLVMNNFGILPDIKQSLFEKKRVRRSANEKKLFTSNVKKGDILISARSVGGLAGHAALMSSDYWVLEMAGGRGWRRGIPDNNRQISKDEWYDEFSSEWITVYRCRRNDKARDAAIWADAQYYNPVGGGKKMKHITYLLTDEIWNTDPSYCAKLVMQAFYFGTGKSKVTRNLARVEGLIGPATIPSLFHKKYKLDMVGRFR